MIEVKIIGDNLPQYATEGSAGLDIISAENCEILPQQLRVVKTNLYIEIPVGYEAQIRSRSGLAARGIFVLNSPGTIDSDYRGEICVILYNIGNTVFECKVGTRIAQMVFSEVLQVKFVKVSQLSETVRGNGGFGSTGI